MQIVIQDDPVPEVNLTLKINQNENTTRRRLGRATVFPFALLFLPCSAGFYLFTSALFVYRSRARVYMKHGAVFCKHYGESSNTNRHALESTKMNVTRERCCRALSKAFSFFPLFLHRTRATLRVQRQMDKSGNVCSSIRTITFLDCEQIKNLSNSFFWNSINFLIISA